jgi:hypothetical protein
MNGVVAAPLQFIANGRLAGAGKAFDQIIPPAHVLENTTMRDRMLSLFEPAGARPSTLERSESRKDIPPRPDGARSPLAVQWLDGCRPV